MTLSIPANARSGRRYRSPSFAGTTAMAAALACIMAAERAQAQAAEACGPVASDGSVQCTGAGNPFPGGISYATPVDTGGSVLDLTVELDADVAVLVDASAPIQAAVELTGHQNASVVLRAADGSSVRANGTNQAGVRIVAESGGIDIAAPVILTTGENAIGIDAVSGGSASIAVESLETLGNGSIGTRVEAAGDIDFWAGRVATDGDNATGVQLTTTSDDGVILASVDEIQTAGERSFGINLAGGQSLEVAVVAGSIVTTGERSSGIRIVRNTGGQGNFDIEADSITTSGTVADGITLITDDFGQAAVRAGHLEVGGLEAAGIYAAAAEMDLDLAIGSALATGQGSAGVFAQGTNVALRSTGTIASTGENGRGITIVSGRDADLTLEGDVTATGARSTAIAVQSNSPDGLASVNMTGDIVTSGYFTTGFSAGGAGRVVADLNNVTNNGEGLSGFAILVTPVGDAEVTVHDVAARGFTYNSTYVRSREGNASLAVTGLYETEFAGGIFVDAWRTASLSVSDMALEDYDTYAVIMTGGDVDLTIRGTIADHTGTVIGDAGPAIHLVAGGGAGTGLATAENAGSVNTYADTRSALSIIAQDTAALTGTGSIHTRGAFATAVTMRADEGGIVLEQRELVTEGDFSRAAAVTAKGDVAVDLERVVTRGWSASGIDIRAEGQVSADIGSIETGGVQSVGLQVSALGGIEAVLGGVSTLGNRSSALRLDSGADIGVAVEGQVATNGRQAFGIVASAAGNLSIAAGDITTQGVLSRGVFATAEGDAVLRHGAISTFGDGADGINLVAGGAVDIALGTVATAGEAADGIDVQAAGAVRAVIGSASVSGLDARAIGIVSQDSVTLEIGTVRADGASAAGIDAGSGTSVSVEVAQGGGVWAANDALVLTAGQDVLLTNHGTVAADSGAAIRASGGPATIWNDGSITGSIVLTDAADLVTNSGTMWLTVAQFGAGDDRLMNDGDLVLAGDLDFGDGNDTLVNGGTLSLAKAATTASGLHAHAAGAATRSITGLNGFANSGTIDLRSGVAGDVLNISGSFAGSGGSTVALDVRFAGTPVADSLNIAGAATGTTTIAIRALDAPVALHSGTVLVSAGAGTRADAFRLDGAVSGGFFASGLAFDAATTSFRLVTAPSRGAYRLLKISEGARSAWLESSDMVAAHLASGRSSGFWFAAAGNVSARDQMRSFEGFGFVQTVDLGYQQDSFSAQLGYGVDSGSFTFGVTAGYANSMLTFDESADRVKYDALNAGLYAALRSGRFYANALAKYDHYDIGVSLQSIGEKAGTDGSAYGARVEAGVRLGSTRFHAEPRVSLSYQSLAVDPLALSAAARFDDWDSGHAAVGLRLARISTTGASELKLYAEADYVRTLGEESAMTFATGADTLAAEDGRFPDHGAGKLGVELSGSGVSGFLEAVARYGEHYRSGGARAGLRIAF